MATLTCIVIGEEDEAQAIGESLNPLEEWSGIEAPGIDTVKLATLHCLLTGEISTELIDTYEPAYLGEEEDGTILVRVPDHVVAIFASLDDEALERVAAELAATEEFELANWDSDDVRALVEDWAELARRAEADVQAMFLWMRPTVT